MKFTPKGVTKSVSTSELHTYKNLDQIPGLAQSVPKLISIQEDTVTMENLTAGFSDSLRMADIKMGTSTLTKKSKHNPEKAAYRQ